MDKVVKPTHYTATEYEPIKVIRAWATTWPSQDAFALGNIVKYACRAYLKDDYETNVRKIAFYALHILGETWRLDDAFLNASREDSSGR